MEGRSKHLGYLNRLAARAFRSFSSSEFNYFGAGLCFGLRSSVAFHLRLGFRVLRSGEHQALEAAPPNLCGHSVHGPCPREHEAKEVCEIHAPLGLVGNVAAEQPLINRRGLRLDLREVSLYARILPVIELARIEWPSTAVSPTAANHDFSFTAS